MYRIEYFWLGCENYIALKSYTIYLSLVISYLIFRMKITYIKSNFIVHFFTMKIIHCSAYFQLCRWALQKKLQLFWATWSSGRCPCSWQGGWNEMIFKVPSNPYHSMILWFYIANYGQIRFLTWVLSLWSHVCVPLPILLTHDRMSSEINTFLQK